jgi:hypothetical protein
MIAGIWASRASKVSGESGRRANPVFVDWTFIRYCPISLKVRRSLARIVYPGIERAWWLAGRCMKKWLSGAKAFFPCIR